jgi:hypothetical protein
MNPAWIMFLRRMETQFALNSPCAFIFTAQAQDHCPIRLRQLAAVVRPSIQPLKT